MMILLLLSAVASAEPAAGAEPATHKESKTHPSHPLWEAELQLGYGFTQTSSTEMSHTAIGPLLFSALGAVAINEEPYVYAVGGLVGEAIDRTAIGVTAGARLMIPNTPVRVTGMGVWMVAPKTLWGATAAGGACFGKGTLAICGDVQVTAYVAGTALPKDELELQVALVLGVAARGGM
ncbi:MAG: hypothetical protein ACKV2T_31430 [Kofleriaceae bacterium]